MKIKPEHLNELKSMIWSFGDQYVSKHGSDALREYYTNVIGKDPRVKDVNKRLMWDLVKGAGATKYLCDVLYQYLDDTHIDTALRALTPETIARYNLR
jgi:hypothetical protein